MSSHLALKDSALSTCRHFVLHSIHSTSFKSSSSVVPFSCLQSFPASGSFPISWLFSTGGQSIGTSAVSVYVSMLLLLLLLSRFSRATPKTAAHQAPPSLGFSRQEHWSGLPFPSPIMTNLDSILKSRDITLKQRSI